MKIGPVADDDLPWAIQQLKYKKETVATAEELCRIIKMMDGADYCLDCATNFVAMVIIATMNKVKGD